MASTVEQTQPQTASRKYVDFDEFIEYQVNRTRSGIKHTDLLTAGVTVALAVTAYLLAGAAGLPVFAGTPERGIGLAYMMGPTAGFLAGFLLAAGLVGLLAGRGWDRSFLTCAAAMVIGHVVIVAAGVAWLASLMGMSKAINVGLMPFLASSALKTALGATAMPLLWRLFGRGSGAQEWR